MCFISFLTSENCFPMNLLTELIVCSGFVIACLLAGSPTLRSPLPPSRNAKIDGVVLRPSLFCITTGSFPSITATQEFVVPKSMPMILPISVLFVFLYFLNIICNACAKSFLLTQCQRFFSVQNKIKTIILPFLLLSALSVMLP